ncbi:MAG: AtpZ/AtpI family protein [Eubacteriales bacterium]
MKNSNKKNPLYNLVLITQLGLSMIIPIIGCFLIGHYLDEKFNTGNILLFIFTILGVMAAFRNLFVIGIKSSTHKRNDKNKE